MGLLHTINIQGDTAILLSIVKKRNIYTVLDKKVLDLSELVHTLKDKNSFYVSIDQDDVLNETVTIPTAVKKPHLIRHMISHKLNDTLQNKKVLLNYHKLTEDPNNDTATYHVDGVYEEEYVQILNTLGEPNKIKSATASRFALFGLSEQCIEAESYLSIYTEKNKVDILAVHKGIPVFNRVGKIMTEDDNSRQIAIANEISSTITYIKQQFHDMTFSTIALSGSVAMDEIVPEHLFLLTQIPITVLYPHTFISGLSAKKMQKATLALGSCFVSKECQFLPHSLIGLRQYLLSQNILLATSFALFLPLLLFTYQHYKSYNSAAEEYRGIKEQLNQIAQHTETYSLQTLQKSQNYLRMAQKYLHHHPSDMFLALKPLIVLQKPYEWSWEYRDGGRPQLSAGFSKSFEGLDALHQFEKRFKKELSDINKSVPLIFTEKTDYANMKFKGIVKTKKSVKRPQKRSRKRR